MHSLAKPTRKVLVVDDYSDTCEVLDIMFKAEGHHVLCASNGDEALNFAEQCRPDVVLTELNLHSSAMGGLSLGKKIRSNSKFDNTVLIAYTGYAQLSQQAADAGFDYFALKPEEAAILIGATYAPRQNSLVILSLTLLEISKELRSSIDTLSLTRSKAIIKKMRNYQYAYTG